MVKARKSYIASLIALSLGTATGLANAESASVTIDLSKQQYIGDVSELTRNKFFNLHGTATAPGLAEMDVKYILNELNADFGRGFWGPMAQAKTANYPSTEEAMAQGAVSIANAKANPKYKYISNRRVATEHPYNVIVEGNDPIEGARWAADFFQYFYEDDKRPIFYEPMNEPFVHAHEFVDGPWDNAKNEEMQRHMATWFAEIGREFDARGIETNVVGFSSAWPSLELNNFAHWESRMKMFMDVAGDHMDGIAFHLYDGVNVTGQDNFRSGSNAEAIMDLQETYSYVKWDAIKPHAVTEYGGIVQGYPEEYSPEKSSQELRSYNHILFSLLAREDRILTSIPFITGAAKWYYDSHNNNPYSATVLYPDPDKILAGKVNGYLPTEKAKFYHLWSEVKGNRVDFTNVDPDLAVHAFVYGNKAYIALNNHEDDAKQVDLSFVDAGQVVEQVRTKRLDVPYNEAAIYSDETSDIAPTQLTMAGHETIVLEYTFAEPIVHSGVVRERSYYNDNHILPIEAGNTLSYEFADVEIDQDDLSFADSVATSIEYDADVVANLNPRLIKLYRFVLRNYNHIFNQIKRKRGDAYADSPVYKAMLKRVQRSGFLRNALMLHYSENGYNDGQGEVSLRMGISRKHDMSKQPVVTVNGHAVEVPNDWAGYDQVEREDFFGVIEIPVPAKFLKTHNTVNVTFDDTQGFVSSMVLNVETDEMYQATAVEGIEFEDVDVSINKDGIHRLTANVLPANASNKYVLWSSSDNTVATVDENGVVGAVAPGFVVISATTYEGEFVATTDITVEDKLTLRNTVTITSDLSELEQSNVITATVTYSSDEDRDVVLSLFDVNNSWMKDTRVTVPAGEGEVTVSLEFNDDIPAGEGYRVLAALHDVGGNWRTSVDGHSVTGINIVAIEPEILEDGTILSGLNTGFEAGDLTDWEFAWDSAGVVDVTTDAANSGDYGLYINTTDGAVGLVVADIPEGMMQAGKKFKLSYDIKRVSGSGWAGGFAQLWNNTEAWVSTSQGPWFGTSGLNQWFTVEKEIDGADWPATGTRLQINFRTAGQEWYLDNVKLEDITPDPNILSDVNGDFESADITPWVSYWENNDTTVMSIADYAASEGNSGLHITADGSTNTGITLPSDITPQDLGQAQGKQYKISFDVKSNNGRITGWFRSVAQGAWDSRVETWFDVGDTWKTVEIVRDQVDWTILDNKARIDLYFNQNGGTGMDVYIDNIRIEVVE
ncbi:Ig-like domain-containing protein [Saccharobesus litoralis]|nr:Ig-like domain-containing protein [Saccharobesus litoralis]